jgi:two-component system, NarL family, response regulator NreC
MRILIADDNQLVRRGVAEILASLADCDVCGEASNGLEAFQKSLEMRPDLVLLDISMPGTNGLETARLLRQEIPEIKILIMSHHDPVHLLPSILEAGAYSCLDKSRIASDLPATIKSFRDAQQRSTS